MTNGSPTRARRNIQRERTSQGRVTVGSRSSMPRRCALRGAVARRTGAVVLRSRAIVVVELVAEIDRRCRSAQTYRTAVLRRGVTNDRVPPQRRISIRAVTRLGLALAIVGALAPPAAANGRAPQTSTIHFRAGHETDIAAGMTFGLIMSHDGGTTWQWICEDAVGYGGIYDPAYAYSATGSLFATTFSGLKVARDGCTFDGLASGSAFASTDAFGPDGAFYYGASQPSDSHIYKSTDDGATFGSGVTPPNSAPNAWWQSIAVAPSDAQRVYAFGYRAEPASRAFLLYKSTDGARTFTPISTDTFVTSLDSVIEIVGVDKTNPDRVYAHVTAQDDRTQHGLYRSDDAGAHWTSVFTISDRTFAFVLRGNGDLLVGTQLAGVYLSHDQGATWTAIPTAPHINCLAENSAGLVWACTQNYAVAGGPPTDHAGIMTSTDGVHWTTNLRFEDITQPVSCGSGTVQHDSCQADVWCGLKEQLGITSTVLSCALVEPPPALEAPVLRSGRDVGGCCDANGESPGALVVGIGIVLVCGRRRAW